MSPISSRGRLSVRPFASVPSLADLPPIQRAQASVSDASSLPGVEGCIDLSEGCFVTKTTKYIHLLTHWVDATRDEDIELVVCFNLIEGSWFLTDSLFLQQDFVDEVLCITVAEFTLDTPCYLVFRKFGSLYQYPLTYVQTSIVECFVHTALELFACVAITPSLSTLNDLIEMVQSNNDRRQPKMDEKGDGPSP